MHLQAAAEMKDRVQGLTNYRVTICTFHSLGVRILRQSIDHIGYSKNFTIYDEDDAHKVIRECMNEVGFQDRKVQPKYFKALISKAKNRLEMPEDVDLDDLTTNYEQLFPKIYDLYQRKLRACEALDFDDLLLMTVRLFRECPEILAYYQNHWKFLLIDEYQDTNHVQHALAQLLVLKTHNIFVVGDPDQSIYSWRGANINNIMRFQHDFPGAQIINLEQNYRSTCNILNAANAVICKNDKRYEKNLWSKLGEGEKIISFSGETDRDEANFVVEEICDHHASGMPLKEMCVFYRTNAQSRVFEDCLMKNQMPYVVVGGISFYQRKEIKDVLAFLRIILSSSDLVSFLRTVNLPKRGLGDTTIKKLNLAAMRENIPIFDFCAGIVDGLIKAEGFRLSAKQKSGLTDYVALIRQLRKLAEKESISELVRATIKDTGLLDFLRVDKETFEDRRANIEELVAKTVEWEGAAEEGSLVAFLEELSLTTTLDESCSYHKDRLNLMTVHNSKGLEFKVVCLVGMEEELFPHVNSKGDPDSLEEERRLFYVGMTRAREFLYLSNVQYRYIWRELRPMRKSRFLNEIPERYVIKTESSASYY